jgi:ubiquitin C-terminal hydrolase
MQQWHGKTAKALSLALILKRYCMLLAIVNMDNDGDLDLYSVPRFSVSCGNQFHSDYDEGDMDVTVTIKLGEMEQSEEDQVEPEPDIREGIPDIPFALRQSGRVSTPAQRFGTTTQGIVNKAHTCYAISILHTLVCIKLLYESLGRNIIVKELTSMTLNGESNVTSQVSDEVHTQIVKVMSGGACIDKSKIGSISIQKDCGEFLMALTSLDEELNDLVQYEVSCKSSFKCKCSQQQEVELWPNETEHWIRIHASLANDKRSYNIQELVADTFQAQIDDRRRGKECTTTCKGCKDQMTTSWKSYQFRTVPKLLVILVNRSEFIDASRSNKLDVLIQVPSSLELKMGDGGTKLYEVVSIICHQGLSHDSGHYVTYLRNGLGKWWLFNDEKATRVESITEAVNAREVYMCFYVPLELVSFDQAYQLIGSDGNRTTRSHQSGGNCTGSASRLETNPNKTLTKIKKKEDKQKVISNIHKKPVKRK